MQGLIAVCTVGIEFLPRLVLHASRTQADLLLTPLQHMQSPLIDNKPNDNLLLNSSLANISLEPFNWAATQT